MFLLVPPGRSRGSRWAHRHRPTTCRSCRA